MRFSVPGARAIQCSNAMQYLLEIYMDAIRIGVQKTNQLKVIGGETTLERRGQHGQYI